MFGSGLMAPHGPGTIPSDMPGPRLPEPKKAGMFGAGKGNIGEIIGALLSGFSAAQGNPAGQFGLQMLHQRRQQAAERAQYGQRREDEFQDWVRRQAYQQANPNPVNNDTVADYQFIASQLGPEQAKEFLRTKTLPPPMVVPGPNGQMFMVPRAMPQQSGPQPGHIEDGFRFKGGNPGDPNAWEPVNGGPTPQASGGFPRSN